MRKQVIGEDDKTKTWFLEMTNKTENPIYNINKEKEGPQNQYQKTHS